MNFLPRITPIAAFLAALSLLVAGCGGGSSSTDSTAAGQTGKPATLAAAEVSELGDVLVDAEGFTVYDFGKDQGSTSSCYGACEEAWPPVLVKGAPSGESLDAGELGTTERKDGSTQVTYAGHPLYTFFEDEAPGEANGNGVEAFGGVWDALDESGEAAGSGTAVSGGGY